MITTKYAQKQAKHLFDLCQANGALDLDRVRHVARYLVKAGNRNCPRILTSFIRLVRLHRREHTVTVESAIPCPADLQAEIRSALAHLPGVAVATEFAQCAALIGGVRIQAGWNVYDGTISAKLDRLARTF